MNSMPLFQGIVEDRSDPLYLGRCKVRVFGVHTDDPSILPTVDLPWAYPMMPITSASISGVGNASVGPVPGTIVVITFQDSDQQIPMMLGSLGGMPQSPQVAGQVNTLYQGSDNNTIVYPNEVGTNNVSTDGVAVDAAAVTTQNADDPALTPEQADAIEQAQNRDEFSLTDARPASSFSLSRTGLAFIQQQEGFAASAYWDYKQYSIGFGTGIWQGRAVTATYPGTVTRQAAATELFAFIESEWSPGVKNSVRVLITQGMFDALVALAYNIGLGGLRGSSVIRHLNAGNYEAAAASFGLWNKAGSPLAVSAGLTRRRAAEAAMFLGQGVPDGTGDLRPADDIPPVGDSSSDGAISSGGADRMTYPRYFNEPDNSRLARGQNIERSPAYAREAARWTDIPFPADTPGADAGTWEQAESPFNAIYPYNKVTQSETGHTIEMDDTPDAERLAFFHRRGSGIEIDHNGTRVDRTVGDNFRMSERSEYVAVGGDNVIYVAGNWQIKVANAATLNIDGPANIVINNDANLYVSGDVNANVVGDTSLNVDGNTALYSKGNTVVTAEQKVDLYSKGDTVVTSEANTIIKTQGNTTVSSRGSMTANVNGDMTATVGGQLTQSVSGTFALKADKILLESRGTIDILGQNAVKIHSTSGNTEVQSGASSSGVEAHTSLGDLNPIPERADNEHVTAEPEAVDLPPLRVNGRKASLQEQFETPDEGPAETFREAMVANGIFDSADLDQGATGAAESPTVNPEIQEPVGNCATIMNMDNFTANMSLSARFTLGSMTKQMARPPIPQFGLSKQDIVCNLYNVCNNVAEFVKTKYPNMTVNSAFRRPGDVRASSRTSQHYLGQAIDFGFSGFRREDFYNAAKDLVASLPYGFDQLILEYAGNNSSWIHISFKTSGNRLNYFTMRDHRRIGNIGELIYVNEAGRTVSQSANIVREARVPVSESVATPADVPGADVEATSANGVALGITTAEYAALTTREQSELERTTPGTISYNRVNRATE